MTDKPQQPTVTVEPETALSQCQSFSTDRCPQPIACLAAGRCLKRDIE